MLLFRNEEVLANFKVQVDLLEFLRVCIWPTAIAMGPWFAPPSRQSCMRFSFKVSSFHKEVSKYGKYYPRGKQKESPAEASGLSPRPTTQLELSIVVSSGTLTCAPKLLFHANNIKNYEFGSPRFYSCSGDKDYSFKRQLQDTWSRLRPCCLSGQNHQVSNAISPQASFVLMSLMR